MTTTTRERRHFSMIRGFHLADFFTLGNAAFGMASIFLAMLYVASGSINHFLLSAAMTPQTIEPRRAAVEVVLERSIYHDVVSPEVLPPFEMNVVSSLKRGGSVCPSQPGGSDQGPTFRA